MTVVAFTSAKGSPGVTTAALALAVVWPRPVMVVEADPAGGDLAAWLGVPGDCLVRLAAAGRHHLDAGMVTAHAVPIRAGLPDRWALPAVPEAAKARRAWEALTRAGLPALLGELDVDVLLDLGRASGEEPSRTPGPVVAVCRPELDQVAHTRALVGDLDAAEKALLLIGDAPYRAEEVSAAVGAPVWGVLPVDQRAAGALRHGERISSRSPLLRAAVVLACKLTDPAVGADVDDVAASVQPAGVAP